MSRSFWFLVWSLLVVLSCAECLGSGPLVRTIPLHELAKFFAQYFEERLRDEPEFATNVGRHEYDDRWSDLSKAGTRHGAGRISSRRSSRCRNFRAAGLSEQDQLSVKLLRYDLRTQLDALDLETYLLRVGQMTGLHNRVYLIIDRMPAFTVKDCENIIARMHAVPAYVDQNIAILNEAIARGMTQPKIVSDLVIEQLTAQVAQDASNTPLLVFLKKMPSSIPEAERDASAQAGDRGLRKRFSSGMAQATSITCRPPMLPQVRPGVGISSLPGREADYAILIRRLTTTNATPEEIHKIGLAEVDRIEGEMLAIARQTGFRDRSANWKSSWPTIRSRSSTPKTRCSSIAAMRRRSSSRNCRTSSSTFRCCSTAFGRSRKTASRRPLPTRRLRCPTAARRDGSTCAPISRKSR